MNAEELTRRYLTGSPLTREERSALARQLGGATRAAQAIKLARARAREQCHEWEPVEPPVGWVAFCYVKYFRKWRVLRDGEIVSAYETESEARSIAARLASDVNAKWLGKVPNPDAT